MYLYVNIHLAFFGAFSYPRSKENLPTMIYFPVNILTSFSVVLIKKWTTGYQNPRSSEVPRVCGKWSGEDTRNTGSHVWALWEPGWWLLQAKKIARLWEARRKACNGFSPQAFKRSVVRPSDFLVTKTYETIQARYDQNIQTIFTLKIITV